ncbi:MAG: hypothetical protein ABIN94_02480 [Ferruginibacter sp.]
MKKIPSTLLTILIFCLVFNTAINAQNPSTSTPNTVGTEGTGAGTSQAQTGNANGNAAVNPSTGGAGTGMVNTSDENKGKESVPGGSSDYANHPNNNNNSGNWGLLGLLGLFGLLGYRMKADLRKADA